MRRTYSYRCVTCGLSAEFIWVSDVPPTDEEVPMTIPCRRLNCQGLLNRSRPVKTKGRAIGQGFLNHDGQLVMMIDPDTLEPQEKIVLNPANAAIIINIPGGP